MTTTPFAELQRWSADVARDPGSPAFLPLARAYRKSGQRAAAIRLCLRALSRHPAHVEGHALLGRLYLEAGDHERAGDEWSIVLRLEPDHFEAHRGLGFFRLERGDRAEARRHLERAAELRPTDPAVQEALRLLGAEPAPAPAPPPSPPQPGRLFEPLLADPLFLGALLLDAEGLVLAGGLKEGGNGSAETLAALLGTVLAEARRTTELALLGGCEGFVLETEEAMLSLSILERDALLLLVATHGAPVGWVARAAGQAAELARSYLGGAR